MSGWIFCLHRCGPNHCVFPKLERFARLALAAEAKGATVPLCQRGTKMANELNKLCLLPTGRHVLNYGQLQNSFPLSFPVSQWWLERGTKQDLKVEGGVDPQNINKKKKKTQLHAKAFVFGGPTFCLLFWPVWFCFWGLHLFFPAVWFSPSLLPFTHLGLSLEKARRRWSFWRPPLSSASPLWCSSAGTTSALRRAASVSGRSEARGVGGGKTEAASDTRLAKARCRKRGKPERRSRRSGLFLFLENEGNRVEKGSTRAGVG